ncbi:hypothetical protein BES08_14160 [Novosphingobium resinovorum]|uniref:ABC transporter domain-containing protein n=1 Tax=Novosphingobium resinovorum TaxID=158500 RepID=A0A1D8A6S1_9SPHN|nr:hypothetical protein BES08_14160 [Novosphingobium resinovorum]
MAQPTASAGRVLQLDAVAKTYPTVGRGTIRAVDSVTAEFSAGEFVSILGPSGCGKSTLMMMIAGLLLPSEGRIVHAVADGDENRFGIVFQDAILLPWRNVLGNVELPGEVRKVSRSARRQKALDMIELVGLKGFEDKFPNELSGGMQQRVAIARALTLDPSLLLMDEPFGALDAMTRDQMNLELQRISLQTGATVVFVTHSISEAAFLSDRVMVMTGRPSTVKEIVRIDIPRPRPIDLLSSDLLGRHISHIRAIFDEGAKHA